MNLIQNQAQEFVTYNLPEIGDYREFIDLVRARLYDYRRIAYKNEFLDFVILGTKQEYDNHVEGCKDQNCKSRLFYENVLFFLQEESEELRSKLTPADFTSIERVAISEKLEQIINNQNLIKLGQELTYDDFKSEFDELKDYYFLNKKNWTQLFLGKLTEMVASGIISETVCKGIVEMIKTNYNDLIK